MCCSHNKSKRDAGNLRKACAIPESALSDSRHVLIRVTGVPADRLPRASEVSVIDPRRTTRSSGVHRGHLTGSAGAQAGPPGAAVTGLCRVPGLSLAGLVSSLQLVSGYHRGGPGPGKGLPGLPPPCSNLSLGLTMKAAGLSPMKPDLKYSVQCGTPVSEGTERISKCPMQVTDRFTWRLGQGPAVHLG